MSLLTNEIKLDLNSSLKDTELEIIVVNNNGRVIYSDKFESIHLENTKMKMFLMGLALHQSMLRDFDDELGFVNYTITERNEKKFISAPLTEKNTILYIAKTTLPNKVILDHLENIRKQIHVAKGGEKDSD